MARTRPIYVLPVLWLVYGSACSTSVEPLTDPDAVPVAVHGYLTSERDVQTLRIAPFRATVLPTGDRHPDLEVITQHIQTNHAITWSPSVHQPDGVDGTLYEAAFRAEAGSYRLTIRDPHGGPELEARTTLPAFPRAGMGIPVTVGGDVSVPLTLLDLGLNPDRADIVYTVRLEDGTVGSHVVPYAGRMASMAGAKRMQITLSADRRVVLFEFARDPQTEQAALVSAVLRLRIPSREWLAPSSNEIQNGAGFFGSVQAGEIALSFAPDILATAGFVP